VVIWQSHCGANIALNGWAGDQAETSIQVIEIPTSNFAIAQHMAYLTESNTGWTNLNQVSCFEYNSSLDISYSIANCLVHKENQLLGYVCVVR
jgi:hypothetical protein